MDSGHSMGQKRLATTSWMSRYPTSQRPHFTGDGHTKPILTEVQDQVLLGQTGLVGLHVSVIHSLQNRMMSLPVRAPPCLLKSAAEDGLAHKQVVMNPKAITDSQMPRGASLPSAATYCNSTSRFTTRSAVGRPLDRIFLSSNPGFQLLGMPMCWKERSKFRQVKRCAD